MREILLEGSLVVEIYNGEHRTLTCSPFNGKVYHKGTKEAFSEVTATDEDEFRRQIQRVISRSQYNKR